jgi:hypothetical protein
MVSGQKFEHIQGNEQKHCCGRETNFQCTIPEYIFFATHLPVDIAKFLCRNADLQFVT